MKAELCSAWKELSTAYIETPCEQLFLKLFEFDRDMYGIAHSEPDGTWWRTGGEVKGKDANGVGSQ